MKKLDLLDKGEIIKYFYSDGLLDVKEGFYVVTDTSLILYCEEWEVPKTKIPFNQILSLNIEYNISFFEDSYLEVTTSNGLEATFPISSGKKRDKDFYNYLLEKSNLQ
jgi:hypothetical protein